MANFFSTPDLTLPSSGTPGDIWFATTSRTIYFVIPGGDLIPLDNLWNGNTAPAVGPRGSQGPTGATGQGFTWRGAWQLGYTYAPYDVVFYSGAAYICINTSQADTGNSPANVNYWQPLTTGSKTATLFCEIDGVGSTPTAPSSYGNFSIPFNCTITGWTLIADQSGSAVIDVQRAPFASFPSGLSSLCGSDKPTISSAQKNENLSVSAWTTALNAGDVLQVYLDSVATVTRLNLALIVSVP